MDKSRKLIVVGLGELLWDILPSGKKLGGAPANFAFHTNSLWASSYIVSAVGEDNLGDEIVSKIKKLNLDSKFVQRDSKHSTGTVEVKLDGSGIPTYIINTDVAWDNILFNDSMIQLAGSCNAVCFGSLAQRAQISSKTISKFLDQTSSECLKIFDVNLRQKFYSTKIIEESIAISNCLKLNENELHVIAEMLSIKGTEDDIIDYLLNTYKLKVVALTKGEKGSMLFTPSEKSMLVPESVEIIDTVGAGDAFTAGMSIGILNGLTLIEIHKLANRIATYVCTKAGATPELNEELINSIK